ncbi:MAG: DNA-binding protein [Microbacteriaceae bacterium]|nr:MAG: DNA-binding protein [Microbacteriaceae bacterium]
MTLSETADVLRKTESQLRWQMHQGNAPASALIGGRRMFRRSDVDAWITAQFEKEAV